MDILVKKPAFCDAFNLTYRGGLPMIVSTLPPTHLDHRQAHPLSGLPGRLLSSALLTHCGLPPGSYNLSTCLHYSPTPITTSAPACLILGPDAKLIPSQKGVKYGLIDVYGVKIPAIRTISPQEFNKQSKMNEFHDDLEVFRRILYMQFLKAALSVFSVRDFDNFVKFGAINALFNSGKLHTPEFNAVVWSD